MDFEDENQLIAVEELEWLVDDLMLEEIDGAEAVAEWTADDTSLAVASMNWLFGELDASWGSAGVVIDIADMSMLTDNNNEINEEEWRINLT